MGMTLSEKILAKASGKESVRPGDIVDAKVDLAMSHEACTFVISAFEEMGAEKVWDKDKIVVILDHWVPASDVRSASLHKAIRKFVREQGIDNFLDVGRGGIAHQILAEGGWVLPGMLVVGTDSHTPTTGALGAFATGIGFTEMAAVFALGELWLKVPENVKVVVNGSLGNRMDGKDIILKVIRDFKVDGAIYKAVEFTGSTIESIGIFHRLAICNMTTEMGAKTGIIAPDDKTREYLSWTGKQYEPVLSDEDAEYQEEREFDITDLEPQVACPPNVDNVKGVSELKNVKVQQAFLGSCTNGRIEDLRAAAEILKGEKVHKDVRMIVMPASQSIYMQAMEEGLFDIFLDANATICAPSCGPCFGGHGGLLAAGEACISSTNRNFVARMGSPESFVYLGSPWTVAASALYGEITDPRSV
ncbi:MAG: 3-isopropylmalate dehydratase large subunit [Methanomassiliicoccales archaeon]|nr:MAG: 3-isopropylmalate dehydratase large subunit [Methanomassiliicoccales archaeon]